MYIDFKILISIAALPAKVYALFSDFTNKIFKNPYYRF